MGFLRAFLVLDNCDSTSEEKPVGLRPLNFMFSGCARNDFFAVTSYPESLDVPEFDDEGRILSLSHNAVSFDDMLEKLGLYGLHNITLKNNDDILMHASATDILGMAIKKMNCGFAQSIVYEVGSDTCHIRLKVKDRWSGSYFPTQIDAIAIWDTVNRYDIPLEMPFAYPILENVLGIIDTTTQALLNDDEPAYRNFALMHEVIDELKLLLSSHDIKTRHTP